MKNDIKKELDYKWQTSGEGSAELRKPRAVTSGVRFYDVVFNIFHAYVGKGYVLSWRGKRLRTGLTYENAKAVAEWLLPAALELEEQERAEYKRKQVEAEQAQLEEKREIEDKQSAIALATEILAAYGIEAKSDYHGNLTVDPRRVRDAMPWSPDMRLKMKP